MLKEADFIQEWIDEAVEKATPEAEARGARNLLLHQLRKRFGELPQSVVERVEHADVAWCQRIGERLFEIKSLEELGIGENGAP
jgi:hypothetical protein